MSMQLLPVLQDLLLQCFNKDPQQRPDARTLLRHPWIQFNRQTLRTSWSKTQGWAAPGSGAHMPMLGWLPSDLHAVLLCFAPGAACSPRATSNIAVCCQTCLLCRASDPITTCRYQGQRWAHRCSRECEQCGGEDAGGRDGGQHHQRRAAAQPATSHQPHRAVLQAAQRRWASASGAAAVPVM